MSFYKARTADSELDKVVRYVLNQKEHHREKSFREEYLDILKRCEVEYEKEEYLFEWIFDVVEG
jgi:putative transposase